MSRAFGRVALVIVSTACAMLVAEGAIATWFPRNLSGTWLVETPTGIRVNRSTGLVQHQLGDRIVQYRFSPPHLRAPVPDGALTVLVVGDSYTFGLLLPDGASVVDRLQHRLDAAFGRGAVALLNAATVAWGTADYVAFVEEVGPQIDPDAVLVFLNVEDVSRTAFSPLWNWTGDDGPVRIIAPPNRARMFLKTAPVYNWVLERSHAVQLAREAPILLEWAQISARQFDRQAAARAASQAERLFRRLHDWGVSHDVALLVSSTGWHQPPYSADQSDPTEVFMSAAPSLFARLGIPYFDPSARLAPVFQDSLDLYAIASDGHPTEAAASLVAEAVFPFLESELRTICGRGKGCGAPF